MAYEDYWVYKDRLQDEIEAQTDPRKKWMLETALQHLPAEYRWRFGEDSVPPEKIDEPQVKLIEPRGYEVDMERAKSLSPALREDAVNFVERFYSGQTPTTEDLVRSLISKQEELKEKRRQDNL